MLIDELRATTKAVRDVELKKETYNVQNVIPVIEELARQRARNGRNYVFVYLKIGGISFWADSYSIVIQTQNMNFVREELSKYFQQQGFVVGPALTDGNPLSIEW